MPVYEYHCDACDNDFEVRRSFKEADTETTCPECESEDVTRKLSLFVALTGSDESSYASGGCGCGGACSCGGHSMN